jgi:shikimate kinase
MQRPIFLVGPRASGKTSLGRILAERLDILFLDTDDLAVTLLGQSIADHVAVRGWDSFRAIETRALNQAAALAGKDGGVIACGGGIVLKPENRAVLARGQVAYLCADPEILARRLASDPLEAQRPSLTGGTVIDEVRDVLARREPLYRQTADVVLDAGLPLEELVERACERLRPGRRNCNSHEK